MASFYIVQETSTGFRPLPYSGIFKNRSAAYRFLRKSPFADGWCKVSNRDWHLHTKKG